MMRWAEGEQRKSFSFRFRFGNLIGQLPGPDENPQGQFSDERPGPGRVIIGRCVGMTLLRQGSTDASRCQMFSDFICRT